MGRVVNYTCMLFILYVLLTRPFLLVEFASLIRVDLVSRRQKIWIKEKHVVKAAELDLGNYLDQNCPFDSLVYSYMELMVSSIMIRYALCTPQLDVKK